MNVILRRIFRNRTSNWTKKKRELIVKYTQKKRTKRPGRKDEWHCIWQTEWLTINNEEDLIKINFSLLTLFLMALIYTFLFSLWFVATTAHKSIELYRKLWEIAKQSFFFFIYIRYWRWMCENKMGIRKYDKQTYKLQIVLFTYSWLFFSTSYSTTPC